MRRITAYSDKTAYGSSTCVMPTTTPLGIADRGQLGRVPSAARASLTRPWSCRRTTHASVRIVKLVQNGNRTSPRSTPRRSEPQCRHDDTRTDRPSSRQTRLTSAAVVSVRRRTVRVAGEFHTSAYTPHPSSPETLSCPRTTSGTPTTRTSIATGSGPRSSAAVAAVRTEISPPPARLVGVSPRRSTATRSIHLVAVLRPPPLVLHDGRGGHLLVGLRQEVMQSLGEPRERGTRHRRQRTRNQLGQRGLSLGLQHEVDQLHRGFGVLHATRDDERVVDEEGVTGTTGELSVLGTDRRVRPPVPGHDQVDLAARHEGLGSQDRSPRRPGCRRSSRSS